MKNEEISADPYPRSKVKRLRSWVAKGCETRGC